MSLYKRGEVWWMDFVYKGRRYRKSTETDDRKLARRIHDKIKGQIAEGKWFEHPPGEEKTFREMVTKYLKEHVSKLISEKSFQGYAKNLLSFFGDYTLSEITPRLVNEYKTKRREDGLKPSSINRELATMKKAFNLAIKEWEWINQNPVSKVSMEKEDNKRDRWLTDDEEKRLLDTCSPWLRELTTFALHTGMRLEEILSLCWPEIDLFRRVLVVLKSKNKEKRTIPINQTVIDMLKAKMRVRSIKTDLVFYTPNHSMFWKTTVDHAFMRAAKMAKIENIKFHDLRHTAATRMVQLGKDLYKVQKILGHKSPMMTQRYAHHYPESLRDAVDALDNRVTNMSQWPSIEEKSGL